MNNTIPTQAIWGVSKFAGELVTGPYVREAPVTPWSLVVAAFGLLVYGSWDLVGLLSSWCVGLAAFVNHRLDVYYGPGCAIILHWVIAQCRVYGIDQWVVLDWFTALGCTLVFKVCISFLLSTMASVFSPLWGKYVLREHSAAGLTAVAGVLAYTADGRPHLLADIRGTLVKVFMSAAEVVNFSSYKEAMTANGFYPGKRAGVIEILNGATSLGLGFIIEFRGKTCFVTARHVWDLIDSSACKLRHGDCMVSYDKVGKMRISSTSGSMDFVVVEFAQSLRAALNVKPQKLQSPTRDMGVTICGKDQIGNWVLSTGVATAGKRVFRMNTTYSSIPGFSGAPVFGLTGVVGVHLGALPNNGTNDMVALWDIVNAAPSVGLNWRAIFGKESRQNDFYNYSKLWHRKHEDQDFSAQDADEETFEDLEYDDTPVEVKAVGLEYEIRTRYAKPRQAFGFDWAEEESSVALPALETKESSLLYAHATGNGSILYRLVRWYLNAIFYAWAADYKSGRFAFMFVLDFGTPESIGQLCVFACSCMLIYKSLIFALWSLVKVEQQLFMLFGYLLFREDEEPEASAEEETVRVENVQDKEAAAPVAETDFGVGLASAVRDINRIANVMSLAALPRICKQKLVRLKLQKRRISELKAKLSKKQAKLAAKKETERRMTWIRVMVITTRWVDFSDFEMAEDGSQLFVPNQCPTLGGHLVKEKLEKRQVALQANASKEYKELRAKHTKLHGRIMEDFEPSLPAHLKVIHQALLAKKEKSKAAKLAKVEEARRIQEEQIQSLASRKEASSGTEEIFSPAISQASKRSPTQTLPSDSSRPSKATSGQLRIARPSSEASRSTQRQQTLRVPRPTRDSLIKLLEDLTGIYSTVSPSPLQFAPLRIIKQLPLTEKGKLALHQLLEHDFRQLTRGPLTMSRWITYVEEALCSLPPAPIVPSVKKEAAKSARAPAPPVNKATKPVITTTSA